MKYMIDNLNVLNREYIYDVLNGLCDGGTGETDAWSWIPEILDAEGWEKNNTDGTGCYDNEDEDDIPNVPDLPDEDENEDEGWNAKFEKRVQEILYGDDDEDDFKSDMEIEQNNNIKVKVNVLKPMKNSRAILKDLVGCADIKKRIDELIALSNYNDMLFLACPGTKLHKVPLHSIFFGRPGTGKTTVCRIFGSLMHEAGVLSRGHVVVCDRGTFIGTLWGDEERSVRQVLRLAQGGVLMIDEAYLLNSKNANDPGKNVIQLLMEVLSDESQRDIAVVMCGYKDQMMELLELNPGLHSRFPNRFEFPDFTVEELLQITLRRVGEYGYHFTRKAWEKYKDVVRQAYSVRDPQTWGNARFVANQLDCIYMQHAIRCADTPHLMAPRRLKMITASDIKAIDVPKKSRPIGFGRVG